MEKDYNGVKVELTPKWWEGKFIMEKKFVIIPDTEYDVPVKGINYGDNAQTDFRTGVIVVATNKDMVGRWCHYREHGPVTFHPFRERFSNGKQNPIENKKAILCREDDMILITDVKIF